LDAVDVGELIGVGDGGALVPPIQIYSGKFEMIQAKVKLFGH